LPLDGPRLSTDAVYAPAAWNTMNAKLSNPATPNWMFSPQAASTSTPK
jgi:hypothetical protein